MTNFKSNAALFLLMSCLAAAALFTHGIFKVIALGGIIGGVIGWTTNWGVIRMLFRPRKPLRIAGFKWSGLLVKKKPELAKRIGEIVEKDLLTKEKILLKIDGIKPIIRSSIEQKVITITAKNLGTLSDVAGSEFLPVVNDVRMKLITEFSPGIEKALFSETTLKWFTAEMIKTLRHYAQTPLVYVVGTKRIDAALRFFLNKFLSWDETERKKRTGVLYSYIYDQIFLHQSGISTKLKEILRENAPQMMESSAGEILDHMSRWLNSEENRNTLKKKISPLLENVAWQFNSSATIFLMFADIKKLLEEGLERHWDSIVEIIQEKLKEKETELFLKNMIREFAPELIEKTDMSKFITGSLFRDLYNDVCECMDRNILKMAESEETFNTLRVKAYILLEKPVSSVVPDWEEHAEKIISGMAERYFHTYDRSEKSIVYQFLERSSENLINNVKIGRIDKKLSKEHIDLIVSQATELIYVWIRENLPDVLDNDIRIGEMVEDEINNFSSQELEKTVKTVAEEELGTIIRMGGYLGILAGAVSQVFINSFLL